MSETAKSEVVRVERKTEEDVCEGDKKGERDVTQRERLFRGQSCLKCFQVSKIQFVSIF